MTEMKAAKKPARQKNCYKTSLLKCMVAQGDESHVVKSFPKKYFLLIKFEVYSVN